MSTPIRVTAAMTHPIQYYAPWFRYIESRASEIRLTVLYASEPSPQQQGVGFGTSFEWDVPLREGYANEVVRASRPGDDFGSGRFWGLDVPELTDAVLGSRPDVVLLSGWHSVTQMRTLLACGRRGIPLLYRGDSHLAARAKGVHLLWRVRTRWLLHRFRAYLSVGSNACAYLESFGIGHNRIFASPHAVDNDFFAAGATPYRTADARKRFRAGLDLPEDIPLVLFVGKLMAHKRPEDVVRALGRLETPPACIFAGSGPREGLCRNMAERYGVTARFLGFSNQSELARLFAVSDCLVLPSDWETWGLVVNEAMATGLPCVVSDRVGCAPDLVEPDRTGEIFPMGDADALANAITRVLDRTARGAFDPDWCRERVKKYDFATATEGLVEGCRVVSSAWQSKG